jgi:hypothetical protein
VDDDGRVPEQLLEAFKRYDDGTYRPRHLFFEDLLVIVASIAITAALLVGIVLLLEVVG